MVVKRIVLDVSTDQVAQVAAFYSDVFGLTSVMDMGWITTLASGETAPVQINIASEGGAGTDVPDMSIEVDDVDAVFAKAMTAGARIIYPLTNVLWGVRRFFLRDPSGKIVNVLMHSKDQMR